MPFDDLDLEFEDEDEQNKKKKSEALHVDGDLEFQAPEGAKPKTVQPQKPQGANIAPGIPRPAQSKPAEVRKIDEARAAQAQARPQAAPAARPAGAPAQPRVVGSSAIKEDHAYDLESQQVVEMREQMRKIQLDAEVKVQVAEFKTEYLTEMLSDMKLASHQIEQLLVRINAKHPDMKNEVLMIKKILADFTAKKRK